MTYLVVKSIHLIGVVTWFAGLFYIFRLFVYHTENQDQLAICGLLETMERRLYRGIIWPSLVITTSMGLAMLYMNEGLLSTRWIWTKFLMLVVLFGYHFYSGYTRKRFLKREFFLTSKQCRLINEVPSLVLLVVVPLAIIKPF